MAGTRQIDFAWQDSRAGERTQNVRAFTVQVRHSVTEAVVGSGIIVSQTGLILTCAHVALAAGMNPRSGKAIPTFWRSVVEALLKDRELPTLSEVVIYFPQISDPTLKTKKARLARTFSDSDDDLVLLELVEPTPLLSGQIAILGSGSSSAGNPFISYGFRRLGKYPAGRAQGTILGDVDRPDGLNIKVDPIQLQSGQIAKGMSGAPVLDVVRNLVVGIISESWFPESSSKDLDTAWAVDATTAGLPPLNIPLQELPEPLKASPRPDPLHFEAISISTPTPAIRASPLPPLPSRWVTRPDLEGFLDSSWSNSRAKLISLVGFGGEGKSTLARVWIESVLKFPKDTAPSSIFWWSFEENSSVESFLEAALSFSSRAAVNPRKIRTASSQAEIIGAMLGAERMLFILDGVERIQAQTNDDYGLLLRDEIKRLLQYFAATDHESRCIMTTRVPLLDFIGYSTAIECNVGRLSADEGRDLLEKAGVPGGRKVLERIVEAWNGYALGLTLVAAGLASKQGLNLPTHDTAFSAGDESKYQQINLLLAQYDQVLSDEDKALIKIACVFREPIPADSLAKLFYDPTLLASPSSTKLDDYSLEGGLTRLEQLAIVHRNDANEFTVHPVIRSYYDARLYDLGTFLPNQLHLKVADSYILRAQIASEYPTLRELQPLVEAVYHGCQGAAYGYAFNIFWELLSNRQFYMIRYLGAYESTVDLLSGFFPQRSIFRVAKAADAEDRSLVEVLETLISADEIYSQPDVSTKAVRIGDVNDPVIPNPQGCLVLHLVGTCLACIDLTKSWPVLMRAHTLCLGSGQDRLAITTLLWIVTVELSRGLIDRALKTSDEYPNGRGREGEDVAKLGLQGYAYFLKGSLQEAMQCFDKALDMQKAQRESNESLPELWSKAGLRHCHCLIRAGNFGRVQRIIDENLAAIMRWETPGHLSAEALEDQCAWACVAGDLASASLQPDKAGDQYRSAVQQARSLSHRGLLIEALNKRGRWCVTTNHLDDAGELLSEALDLSLEGAFLLSEADIRISLGALNKARGEYDLASQQLSRADQIVTRTGYAWPRTDAQTLGLA